MAGVWRLRRRAIGAAAGLAALVATVGLASTGAEAARGQLALRAVGQFEAPTFITQPPGNSRLLFVTEQPGRIMVVRDGHVRSKPFLDISDRISSGGEQGLLSMAFDPNYAHNRRFYVYVTNHHCDSGGACNVEVDQYRRSKSSAFRARRASRRKVIEVLHDQAGNHDGGQVAFGPDGDLYLAPGDGGTQEDPENDAQRTDSLLGKILRIHPKANGGYTSPASNPFAGTAGRDEIYSLGLRNPFRFSFDSQSGDLWVGDVGDNTWEEIDHVARGAGLGANFGWHFFEGPDPCTDCGFTNPPPPPHYVPPVHAYRHSGSGETGNVIIGGYVVHDPRLPTLDGRYVYTDDGAGDLRAFNPATGTHSELGLDVSAPSSFGEGTNGAIYVGSLGTGKVYRLIDRGAGRTERAARSRPHARLHRVGDFDRPIDIAAAPGVKRTFYVVERPGRVIAVNGRHRHTFLSIASRTTTDGERGLLSIAFSPHFHRDHLVYAYYTNRGGNIEIDSFRASARHAHRSSRRKVIVIPHPGESNHNGGQLQFGPDGDLYFATGDGGGAGDQHHNAQNTHALLGKLLRIEPRRHGKRYRVPRSNPFVGRRGRDEIFALGLRNPFRFSFDGGRIAIGDVGQDSTEEIDYETHRSLRGANFGWNRFEGDHTFDRNSKLGGGHYERPIRTYPHGPGCAVIGGYVVRDPALASLRGRYVYTDLCTGALRSLVPHRKRGRGDRALGLHVADPSSFGEAHHHLYIASLDGPVYRFVAKR